jgi:hypothetical protein
MSIPVVRRFIEDAAYNANSVSHLGR